MKRMKFGSVVLALGLCAMSLGAQGRPTYGAAIEARASIGQDADSTKRHGGLAIRMMADGAWN